MSATAPPLTERETAQRWLEVNRIGHAEAAGGFMIHSLGRFLATGEVIAWAKDRLPSFMRPVGATGLDQ